jgi:hypothetical protein
MGMEPESVEGGAAASITALLAPITCPKQSTAMARVCGSSSSVKYETAVNSSSFKKVALAIAKFSINFTMHNMIHFTNIAKSITSSLLSKAAHACC